MRATLWSLVLVCALSVLARAAPRVAAASDPRTEGHLVTQRDGKVVDVPLEHTEVAIRVDGFLAEATLTQRFRNPYPAKIEAVYLFPLPTAAAVTDLTIVSGSRTIRGMIQERAQATQTYVAARERGLIAALLTQERPNLFTQSIANLEPSAVIEVKLTYAQRLTYEDGGYELVFPMVAGPRYVPAAAASAQAAQAAQAQAAAVQAPVLPPGVRSSHDIGLTVELDAGVPIEAIESPSHQLAIARPAGAPARASVKIHPSDTIPNKDFVLRYRVAGAAPRFGVLAHRAADAGPGSFVLIAQPPAAPPPRQIAPRELVLVLDTSSSMRGLPLAKAKDLAKKLLRTLRPDDTFQIVRFDDRASPLGPAPIANKPRNVDLVLDWLAALEAGGGTELVTGIDAALAVPHDPARLRIVVFLTDGYIGNEDEVLAHVGGKLADARLFAFGVGTAVNRYLLEELAALGRGAAQVVRPDEDSAAAVDRFARLVDAPLLTDVRVDWGGLAVTGVAPRAVPDLFAGQPLVLAGRYTAPGAATVTVRGTQAGREVSFQVPVALPAHDPARPAVAAVWARQRIAELSRRLVRAPDEAARREILELSLEHRLLTQYTAFVAVDESRVTGGGPAKRVAVPVEVPEAARGVTLLGYGTLSGTVSGFAAGGAGYGVSAGFGIGGGGSGFGTLGIGAYGSIGHGAGGSFGAGSGSLRGRVAYPAVIIGQVANVQGALDKVIIRRYLRRHLAKITYCYEKQLLSTPTLAGTSTASFTINEAGMVTAVTVTGMNHPAVESCVADVIRAIEFPSAKDGGAVKVNYPFKFQPDAAGTKEQP